MEINRRELMTYFSKIVAITGATCSCKPAFAQGLGGHVGCLIANNPLLQLQASGQLSQTTGNFGADQLLTREINRLRSLMGINPVFFIFNDAASPNALANPNSLVQGHTGTILFGKRLMTLEYNQNAGSLDTIIGIIAHEFGHILEFSVGLLNPSARLELAADYLAGWYIGVKHRGGETFQVQSFARSLYNKGDYQFNQPGHHGTPNQRVQAMSFGYKLATENNINNAQQALQAARSTFSL